MYSWGSDIEPAPLKLPCVACGAAERYRSRLGLCEACERDHNAEMEELDQREREADDRDAHARYYGA